MRAADCQSAIQQVANLRYERFNGRASMMIEHFEAIGRVLRPAILPGALLPEAGWPPLPQTDGFKRPV
jgi:hypothetical protein